MDFRLLRKHSTIRLHTLLAAVLWTLAVGASLAWNLHQVNGEIVESAKIQARAYINKDLSFRLWATSHGGVYVPPDANTPPNPYLSNIPERDVTTTGGKRLTLMDPAYMLRQIIQGYSGALGIRERITSLHLLNPDNAPDPWEKQALQSFSHGAKEAAALESMGGARHLRMMLPMFMEPGCMKCHAYPGARVGEVRGGISVSVPLEQFEATAANTVNALMFSHGAAWLLGVSIIGFLVHLARQRENDQRRAEEELNIAATAFDMQEGMIVANANGVILRVNRAFTELTGYSAEESRGKMQALLKSERHDDAFYRQLWKTLERDKYWQGEVWKQRKNGEDFMAWLTISAVTAPDGRVTHYIVAFSDITEHKDAEKALHEMAFYDSLTHLPNRRLLLDRLRRAIAAGARSGRYGAVLFIDLDNFKTLNDTKGHGIGDLLLTEVAHRLLSCVREEDSVARFGGDEFMVMLENLSNKPQEAAAHAMGVGKKILDAIGQPYSLANYQHHSTASIGISLFLGHAETAEEQIKRADVAMYQAKSAGRNTFCFFDAAMQQVLETRAALESDLRVALPASQFRLYYQMQVDRAHRIVGAEVLLRWQHPERGLVSPAQFIPLAEDSGLIVPIGHWVLESSCTQLKTWEASPATRDLQLAVNVSARQFRQPDFVDQVQAILDYTGANPVRLKLELTESVVLENVAEAIEKMHTIRSMGINFSMDDFGTGFSSLSYLKRLPLSQLKIDQSFVRDLATDANDAVIVHTIIGMAKSLGLHVIAEGVETGEQLEFLMQHDCPAFQGYFFGRPVPLQEFEALLSPHEIRSHNTSHA